MLGVHGVQQFWLDNGLIDFVTTLPLRNEALGIELRSGLDENDV
jgi:hypothetical protein